jgi:arylsulfatase A-like enzyme
MAVKNILFIMADQMRADCWGAGLGRPGSKLETPALEALARRGTRFERAYCPSPICGPSRMSFYTGLMPTTHGSTVNQEPLPVGTVTLGDRMRALGIRTGLAGKTHMRADVEGMKRLGLSLSEAPGALVAECGFEPWARDDGLHPLPGAADRGYNAYLRGLGHDLDNPWHDVANSAEGPDGEILSGWYLRNADKPARIDRAHSETAWTTDRAMAFIEDCGDRPWCLHLSYIKPHWPYIAPAPYHEMYREDDAWDPTPPPETPHPLHRAFMDHPECAAFRSEEVRRRVIPTYLGLIREVDDHVGRLMAWLETRGALDETLIVFTSDHGDYLGDHGLGEKQLFHDESAAIPLIVVLPGGGEGRVVETPVDGIDLIPTFLDAVGGDPAPHALEGRSLMPFLTGGADPDRPPALSELNYATRLARRAVGVAPDRARGWMITDGRWKYIHWLDLPDQLYDLAADPREVRDLADDPARAGAKRAMRDHLTRRLEARFTRCAGGLADVEAETDNYTLGGLIKMGVW